jgi:mono/diheme cytochrome c family protein
LRLSAGMVENAALRPRGTASRGVRSAFLPGALALCVAVCVVLMGGCRQDMHVQPKILPLAPSRFFDDGRSARPVVPGTIARGQLRTDELLYTGKINGVAADTFPFLMTRKDLERGQERFNIYCAPCHGRLGNGQGMIVQRGFPAPPSYHIDRLRQAPAGHFFDVMTNGFGMMFSYASRVKPEDRWRIVAYIRALQLSQHAGVATVPEEKRTEVQGAASSAPTGGVR